MHDRRHRNILAGIVTPYDFAGRRRCERKHYGFGLSSLRYWVVCPNRYVEVVVAADGRYQDDKRNEGEQNEREDPTRSASA